jgi:hypothetical protein
LLRDRPNGARGQRRRQKRRAFRRKPVPSDCIATRTRDAWSTRTVLDSKSRSDLERSPLHDVKQHTPARRTWAGRESLSLLDEQNGTLQASRFVALKLDWRQRQEFCRAGDFTPEPEQKRMPDRKLSKPQAISVSEYRAERPNTVADRRIATADLVEPDGIEPTTSCLQSRRSPN